jgi:hypothetical protein
MTITGTTIAFGNIDPAGTAQPPTINAAPFRDTGGSYWVAESGIKIDVTSPGNWVGRVCEAATGSLPPAGGMSFTVSKPDTLQTAKASYENSRILTNCASTPPWKSSGTSTPSSTTVYLTTKVADGAAVGAFDMKIIFSATAS